MFIMKLYTAILIRDVNNFAGVCLMGPNAEPPFSVIPLVGEHLNNVYVKPVVETLVPLPWVKSKVPGRQMANMLCEVFLKDGKAEPTSPRQIMTVSV